MFTGFRAGTDAGIAVAADDFIGTRRMWGLTTGTAQIGRVFPAGPDVTPAVTPAALVARLDKAVAPVLAADMSPYVSFKPDVAAARAGQLDAHFTAVGKWAAGLGGRVYLSLWHEPENDPMGAAPTDFLGRATNFVAMHCRGYTELKAAAGDVLRVGPCYMVYKWLPGTAETADGPVAAAWHVPDGFRDFVAGDAYTANWSWTSVGTTLAAKRDFQRWLTALHVVPAELIVAERGISRTGSGSGAVGDAAQAAILAADYQYMQKLGALGLLYWNSAATDNSVFLLGPAARAVFASAALAAVVPPPVVDRYLEGVAAGRAAVLAELATWMAGHATG
jgi:hypothetical protein